MKTRTWLGSFAIVASAIGMTAWVCAQAPGATATKKIYTNRMAFKLPLRVDEKDRPRLQEVQLYVRQGGGGTWTLAAKAPPTQNEFIYRAPEEGEYWFAIVTIDQAGRMNPADLSQETPGLIVVVDKQPPEINVQPTTSPFGQPLIKYEPRDLNLDPSKTKLEYMAADQSWQPLAALPDQPNLYRVPDPNAIRGVVRASATDLAGNTVSKEINLTAASTPADSTIVAPPNGTVMPPAPMMGATPSVLPPSLPPVSAAASSGSGPMPSSMPTGAAASPALAGSAGPSGMGTAPPMDNSVVPARVESRSDKIGLPAAPGSMPLPRQFLASTHASVKFQLDQPANAGVVEVWMTPDEGQTWQKLPAAPPNDNQIDVTLPGEGSFGLSLAVATKPGDSAPPNKGEAPDWRIVVDLTKPDGQVTGITACTGLDAGSYDITWTASDNNLKPEPIDLDFAMRPDGPWMPIAHGLKNDGKYRWTPVRPPNGDIYVRMQVYDMAGNTTVSRSTLANNMVKPKARVLGVTSGPTGPGT